MLEKSWCGNSAGWVELLINNRLIKRLADESKDPRFSISSPARISFSSQSNNISAPASSADALFILLFSAHKKAGLTFSDEKKLLKESLISPDDSPPKIYSSSCNNMRHKSPFLGHPKRSFWAARAQTHSSLPKKARKNMGQFLGAKKTRPHDLSPCPTYERRGRRVSYRPLESLLFPMGIRTLWHTPTSRNACMQFHSSPIVQMSLFLAGNVGVLEGGRLSSLTWIFSFISWHVSSTTWALSFFDIELRYRPFSFLFPPPQSPVFEFPSSSKSGPE